MAVFNKMLILRRVGARTHAFLDFFTHFGLSKIIENAWVQRQAVPFYTQIKDLDKRASTHPTR